MQFARALVGALVGGIIGATIWGVIAYHTGYEIGWIAWGVGVLCGIGAVAGSGGRTGDGTGILAAVVALAAIAGGKLAAWEVSYSDAEQMFETTEFDDDILMSLIADDVAQQYMEEGIEIDWPVGMTYEDAWLEEDYPADLWDDAMARWESSSPADQQIIREAYRNKFEEDREAVRAAMREIFTETRNENFLSGFDALWILFAVMSAFGIGRGGVGGGD
ncbi:MAG: hypothetical protein AAFX79_02455 [Planctomycetota bacterium]